jgi:hypothetical protein
VWRQGVSAKHTLKPPTGSPGCPGGGTVRPPCALSAHRGDRGLHGASEANGKAAPWSPPSPAVLFSLHAPYQHTAETAGSMAHPKRTAKPHRGARRPRRYRSPSMRLISTPRRPRLHGASEANGKAAPWSPPSPAVPFSLPAPYQHTAETAGSMAHPKRTEKPHRGARRPRRYRSPSLRLIPPPLQLYACSLLPFPPATLPLPSRSSMPP